ncbi:peptidase inhibitor family I36 protein [Amycolatopsis sp. cmx-4-68]|uniref:peptidase inhibitor family I36 protein n=1 Tax=Amycolatopsis sp. cmx-4-68 TaxID=2790938 RepID=UPI00397C7E61
MTHLKTLAGGTALCALLLSGSPATAATSDEPIAHVLSPAESAAASANDCADFRICFWTGDYYSGTFVAFSGNYAPCEGWRFEGTILQDHTYSFWNRASGPVSVWDRYADGSYNYTKLGRFARGFADDYRFSYRTDAWVYDPDGTCTSLKLHHWTGS